MQGSQAAKIFLTCTKDGFKLKETMKKYLEKNNHSYEDIGVPNDSDNTDVLDIAVKLYSSLSSHAGSKGVFITDYGSDAAMYMNKFKDIRCAYITDYYTADMCRKHNDANVAAFAQGSIGSEVATQALEAFLTAQLDTEGAHTKRIAKISAFEKN